MRQKACVANGAKLENRFYNGERLFALGYGEKGIEREAQKLRFVCIFRGDIARNVGNVACECATLKRIANIKKALYQRAIVDVKNVCCFAKHKLGIAEHLAANESVVFHFFRAFGENGDFSVLCRKHCKHFIEIAYGRFSYDYTFCRYKHGKTSFLLSSKKILFCNVGGSIPRRPVRCPVFASAGAGLWATANDQLKFYKMLMNLGLGDNGVRILKEDTVKELLARSTRPETMGGYSLGLWAPVHDDEDAWFGHGGAWGTDCAINWHKKQLKIWVVQNAWGGQPWKEAVDKAAEQFFAQPFDNSSSEAYVGRTK